MAARYLHKVTTSDGSSEVGLIGHVFSWTINKDEFKRDDVLKAFEDNGLDTGVVREIRKKSAFIRAVRKAAEKKLVHEVEETDDRLTFQFDRKIVELQDDEAVAKFVTEAVITYDKKADAIYCKNPEVAVMVKQLIGDCQVTYSKMEISKFIINFFEKYVSKKGLGKLIPMRRAGGSYFASAIYSNYVFAIEKMLTQIDPGADFPVLEICDTARSKETVKKSFDNEMVDEANELKKKLQALEAEGDDMSKTVYKNMIADIQAHKERILMMRELLQYNAEAAEEAIKEAETKIKAYFIG